MNILWLCILGGGVTLGGEPLPEPRDEVTPQLAAQLFRIQVYESFRLDREEFDRRRAQGEVLWRQFDDAKQPAAQRAAVIEWFAAARAASTPDQIAELPPLPDLSSVAAVAESESPALPALDPALHVATSGVKERGEVPDTTPAGAATSLDVQLPKGAVQTGPTRVFSTLLRTLFSGSPSSSEPKRTDVEIQRDVVQPGSKTHGDDRPAVTPTIPVKAIELKPSTATPLDLDSLFEPATTPVAK